MDVQRLLLKCTTLYLLRAKQVVCKIWKPLHLTLTTLKPYVRLVTLKHIGYYIHHPWRSLKSAKHTNWKRLHVHTYQMNEFCTSHLFG